MREVVKSPGKCWDTRPDMTAVSSPLESLWLIGKLLPQVKIKILQNVLRHSICICIWGMEQKWSRNFWQLIFSSGNTSRRLKYASYFSSSKSEYINVVHSTYLSLFYVSTGWTKKSVLSKIWNPSEREKIGVFWKIQLNPITEGGGSNRVKLNFPKHTNFFPFCWISDFWERPFFWSTLYVFKYILEMWKRYCTLHSDPGQTSPTCLPL